MPRKTWQTDSRVRKDLNTINFACHNTSAFGRDGNAKIRLCIEAIRWQIVNSMYKADNVPPLAELLPSNHYRNDHP